MLRFLLHTVAVIRLTTLITEDEIMRPVRERVRREFPNSDYVAYLIACNRCVSVWAGFFIAFITHRRKREIMDILLTTLALSQSSIILRKLEILAVKRLSNPMFD